MCDNFWKWEQTYWHFTFKKFSHQKLSTWVGQETKQQTTTNQNQRETARDVCTRGVKCCYLLFLILRKIYEVRKKGMWYPPPTLHILLIMKSFFLIQCTWINANEMFISLLLILETLFFVTFYGSIGEIITKVARVIFVDWWSSFITYFYLGDLSYLCK